MKNQATDKEKMNRNSYLDKYLDKHNLDLTIEMISLKSVLKPSNNFATHTKIECRKTKRLLVDEIVEFIPDDNDILNWIKPIIRLRNLNQLFY